MSKLNNGLVLKNKLANKLKNQGTNYDKISSPGINQGIQKKFEVNLADSRNKSSE